MATRIYRLALTITVAIESLDISHIQNTGLTSYTSSRRNKGFLWIFSSAQLHELYISFIASRKHCKCCAMGLYSAFLWVIIFKGLDVLSLNIRGNERRLPGSRSQLPESQRKAPKVSAEKHSTKKGVLKFSGIMVHWSMKACLSNHRQTF